ncbi:MAG: Lon family ATP-dependent protease [Bacillota bacterium]
MKSIFERLARGQRAGLATKLSEEDQLRRQVNALFSLLSHIYGADKLVLKAGKLEALDGMRSEVIEEKVLALQKLVYEDPTLEQAPPRKEIPAVMEEIEEEIADIIARRSVEEKIEKKIAERMQQRHEEYVREIKLQIVKEDSGPENAQTLKKYAILEKLEQKKLARSVLDLLRPASLAEVVGQDQAVKALLSKLAAPYPQHILLYGPPGVGKTTVARLVLEEAKQIRASPFDKDAPFVEVDGTTLRWDPREVTNPLLGSVHDPIYQGARRDLADGGIPEPKLGLVTESHGGILFIDEIGELDPMLQNKLLKVLEDKRVTFDSSYYDPSDTHVPKYIKKLFAEGAPADFVLIGATTRAPEHISPAIRSRCAEVYFEPLGPADIILIIKYAAKKLGVKLEAEVPSLIAEYTIEGRKAIGILADAYGLALYRSQGRKGRTLTVHKDETLEVIQSSRLSPSAQTKASAVAEVGRAFGLGVHGYVGSVLEIEAVAFPAREPGKGAIRFNDTAGSMAKDSVFNAATVIRRVTGQELADFDLHVNIVGGAQIDGPSAGCAILIAIISALQGRPVRQDVAVTGEVSVRGRVRPVGGIVEKIYGAKQAGMVKVVLPADNAKEVPARLAGLEVVPAEDIEDVLAVALADGVPPVAAEKVVHGA